MTLLAALPDGWEPSHGAELFGFVRGVSYKKGDAVDRPGPGLVAVLRAGNLQGGRIILDDLVYVPDTYVRDDQRLRPGDLIIAMSSGSASVVGKVASVDKDYADVAFGAFCGLIRPFGSNLYGWLRQYFQTREYRQWISSVAAGININNLKWDHLSELEIPLAPLNEQRRIVAKIEELTARSRRAREALEAVPPLLEQLRQSVLAAAFSGRLTADWREKNNLLAPRPGKYFVYVIGCDDGSRYIGQTDDLPRRWQEHKDGKGAPWTKAHKPVQIVHWEEFDSREEAVAREKWLKTGFGRKWIKREIAAGRARQARDVEPASVLLERIRTERRQRWEENELAKLRAKGNEPKDDRWKDKYKEPAPVDPTGLPELPEGWCWANLARLCDRVSVGHVGPTSEHYCPEPAGVPFIRSQNVRPRRLDASGIRYIKQSFHESLKKSQLFAGDLLIVRVGANRGDVCVLPDIFPEVNCANIVFARPLLGISEFIAEFCQSAWAQQRLLGMTTGSAQGVINTQSAADLPIPIPPTAEQKIVIDSLGRFFGSFKTLNDGYDESEGWFSQIDQSILAKAFRGELVPQDPNDEPASVLLERIRAQRAAAEADKKKKKKSSRPLRSRGEKQNRKDVKSPTDDLQTVLHFLQTNPGPHSKQDILTNTNLDPKTWPTLAPQLNNHAHVHRTGQKRGTKYLWGRNK